MKKKYLSPEMEIIDLEDVDIITTSGDGVSQVVNDGTHDEGGHSPDE